MKKIIILFCILISTNAFANHDDTTTVSEFKKSPSILFYASGTNQYNVITCNPDNNFKKVLAYNLAPQIGQDYYDDSFKFTPKKNHYYQCRCTIYDYCVWANQFKDYDKIKCNNYNNVKGLNTEDKVLRNNRRIDPKPGLYLDACVTKGCKKGYKEKDAYTIVNDEYKTWLGYRVCTDPNKQTNKQETPSTPNTTTIQNEEKIKKTATDDFTVRKVKEN